MPEIEIKVYGTEILAVELEEMGARSSDISPLWPEVTARLEKIEEEQFATHGGRSGHSWPELDNTYMWRKWNSGLNLNILRATDAMFNALTAGGEHAVRRGEMTEFEFGADLKQFRIQQDPPLEGDFPVRLPIDLTEADELMFTELISGWVVGSRNRIGQYIDPATGRFVRVPQ